MSLSDYIKYLRARNGGLTPWEIAEKSGVSTREIHLIEVKHRRVGDNDKALESLAKLFSVPVDDLTSRRESYRKRLTQFLEAAQQSAAPVVLKLESGEQIAGIVEWFAREAVAVLPPMPGAPDGDTRPFIVQRGWVLDWRRADNADWEVDGAALP